MVTVLIISMSKSNWNPSWNPSTAVSCIIILPGRGSGRWLSWVHYYASPSRSQSGTPPGPYTAAGKGLRHKEGSFPTAEGPGRPTGSWVAADQTLGFPLHLRGLHCWLPATPLQTPVASLCLEERKEGDFIKRSNETDCFWQAKVRKMIHSPFYAAGIYLAI